MAGHTKGPWFLEGDGDFREVSAPDHHAFARVVWQMEEDRICGESSPTQEANARLIAAAPCLLEAGQKLMRSIQEMDPEQRGCSTVAYAEMWEAIAKATQP